ncbi:glycosyltransferase family 4 protein [Burkholderiaceae bacterium]|nr:glycosyltransferase family 4 protein [Burkholderiaceae bacterium]
MRVLVVSQYFWPETFRITEVVQSLRAAGCDVTVLTGQPNYSDGVVPQGYSAASLRTQIHDGLMIHRVPLVPRGNGSGFRLALNYLSFVVSATFFGPWLLRGQRVDVIFVYAPSPVLQVIPAVLLKWIKGAKLVTWVQDLWPDSLAATGYVRNRRVLRAVEWVVRWIYRHTDLLLVQSRAFEASVAALSPGKPIAYYPNSVDATFAEPPSSDVDLPEVPELDEGFAVVFAGNVGEGQAVEVMVEAAALLKDVPQIRFVVFGQGSRWNWMHEKVRARELTNLHLPGRFPVNTMPGLMQKAGALLVTLADEPIFALTVPNKVQAYMAAGRPILACLNGEGARLVEEAQAGLSVPAQDAKALADAVLQLYRMPAEDRAQLGANGRRYFKAHFDHDKLVDELIAHLRGISKIVKETV